MSPPFHILLIPSVCSPSEPLYCLQLITMASQPHVRYARVPNSDSDAAPDFAASASAAPPSTAGRARGSNDADIRFAGPDIHRRVPKRSVLLALFLLFLGCASLATFYLMQTGQVEAGAQQKWTCLAIALLTLMPALLTLMPGEPCSRSCPVSLSHACPPSSPLRRSLAVNFLSRQPPTTTSMACLSRLA
ncbi:unnamed protein product [Closterium sp. NIES-65]|nr:unnamed protein product [Closterium sp. NIES-65]